MTRNYKGGQNMTNLPNHMRDIGKQKSFSLFIDQYERLDKIAKEKKNNKLMAEIVRRGVDLALEEYDRLMKEIRKNND